MIGAALLVLHGIVYGGLAVWLAVTAEQASERRVRLVMCAAALASGGVVLAAVDPAALSLEALTPVREGSTDVMIRVARGEGAGVGVLHTHAYLPWFCGDQRSLDVLMRMNLAFLAVTLVGLVGIGWHLTRSWPMAALVPMVWSVSIPVRVAVTDSGPGPALWPSLLVVAMGLAGWWHGERAVTRWGGAALALLAGGLVALGRTELALLPGLGLGLGALHRAGAGTWVAASWSGHPLRWIGAIVALTGIALATWTPVTAFVVRQGHLAWVGQALHPLDLSVVTYVPIQASMWPLGLVALATVGALRAPARSVGLGLAFLSTFRLHHAAGHGGWWGSGDLAWPLEMLRYAAFDAPLMAGLAFVGWQALPAGSWRFLALLTLFVPPIPGLWPASGQGRERAPMWTTWGQMDLDHQQEVRLLLWAMREHPACGFVAPGELDPSGHRSWYAWRSTWSPLSANERRLIVLRDGGLDDAIEAVPGSPSCVLLYLGMACAEPGPDPCPGLRDARRVIEARTFVAHPHAHPDHGWDTTDPWTAAWMQVR